MGGQAIVVSTSGDPINIAAMTFEQTFLQERKSDSLIMVEPGQQIPDADVVVALGSASAKSLVDIETPTVHCMTLHAQEGSAALVLEYPIEEQLRMIQKALPRSTRLGVVYSDDHSAKFVERARDLVANYGKELIDVRINRPSELNKALKGLANRVDVLWGVPDVTLYNPVTAQTVLVFSFRHRVPFIGLSDSWVEAGAAIGPSYDPRAIGKQCAGIAGELLDGTPVSEIGVRMPTIMPYTVNRHSLETLNMSVASSVIEDADHVY